MPHWAPLVALLLLAAAVVDALRLDGSAIGDAECPQRQRCVFYLVREQGDAWDRFYAVDVLAFASTDPLELGASSPQAPLLAAVQADPSLGCASFVTFQYLELPSGTRDCTTLAPGFALTSSALRGGWSCEPPNGTQNLLKLFAPLAQLTLPTGGTVGLNLRVQFAHEHVDLTAACGPNPQLLQLPAVPPPSYTTVTTTASSSSPGTTSAESSAPAGSAFGSTVARDVVIGLAVGLSMFVVVLVLGSVYLWRRSLRAAPVAAVVEEPSQGRRLTGLLGASTAGPRKYARLEEEAQDEEDGRRVSDMESAHLEDFL